MRRKFVTMFGHFEIEEGTGVESSLKLNLADISAILMCYLISHNIVNYVIGLFVNTRPQSQKWLVHLCHDILS